MKEFVFSKEMARQFALDIYDQLMEDIKAQEERDSGSDEQYREEGVAA
jgi:hypothetical protein